MTHEEFVFWLKGVLDATNNAPDQEQLKMIADKLSKVRNVFSMNTTTLPYLSPSISPPFKPGL